MELTRESVSELLDLATAGPWSEEIHVGFYAICTPGGQLVCNVAKGQTRATGALLAAAPALAGLLLDAWGEVRRLRMEMGQFPDGVENTAHPDYCCDTCARSRTSHCSWCLIPRVTPTRWRKA